MVFRFRGSAEISGPAKKAQAVGEALARISKENAGVIAARDVVAEARAASSPLHEFFTWDDTAAARAHRMHQAKKLVKAVVVQVPDSDVELPAFTAVAADEKKKRGIRDGEAAFAPAGTPRTFTMPLKTRQESLEEARRELEKFRRTFAALDELGPVMRAIDEQMRELDTLLLEQMTRSSPVASP
jgi:hypothetical protein